jgi:amidase
VPPSEIVDLAARYGLKVADKYLGDWSTLISGLNHCAKQVQSLPDYYPVVDTALYPRSDIHLPPPEDRDEGGWAWKANVVSTKPKSDLLKGKTVTLKDNIALAGVKCTNGTGALDWTPNVDATLVTRILDAGGIITGKAACENNCFGAVSDTSVTGPVHNPYAHGYSTAGSSSGSARLVASGQCWASVGGDQGGSVRLPSAMCGIVGLKPTWGLVPYTGVISLEATIDHVGPMARSVVDTALLLEAMAGADGVDDRQPDKRFLPHGGVKYSEIVKEHLAKPAGEQLKGLRIGILKEGFADPLQNAEVAATVKAAIAKFTEYGAECEEISVPEHTDAALAWMVALPMAGTQQGLLGFPSGRKQLLFPDRAALIGAKISQESFDKLGPGGQNIYLRGLFLREKFGAELSAKCTNLLRKVGDAYDRAFEDVDVVVLPTVPFPAVKLRTEKQLWGNGVEKEGEMAPLEMLSRTIGATSNTAAFNSTGHPGLSVPCGFVSAKDDADVKLPTGLQIVGRRWEDDLVLKVGATWEQNNEWKSFKP